MSTEFVTTTWIDALWSKLRDDNEFAKASRTWLHGPIALVMEAAPDLHFPETVAIRLDVHEGAVRDVRAITLDDLRLVPTQLWAGFARWKKLLGSNGDLVDAALESKARVVGDLSTIVRHRALFAGAGQAAASIDTEWQDDAAAAAAAARETAGATA